ncbi:MAG: M28 family peptidase [Saprospiraceae bacterium]|nr:M28 family peptidase [Saprospiraceae bacterium]
MKAQKARLYEDVRFLTEIRPFRNHLNTESLERVCVYISEHFSNAGLLVSTQKWIAGGKEYTNVLGVYNPGKPRRLIVGAHYDVCGNQAGADDNASAVAGLLETARLLGKHKPQMDYTVELVAYCLEEPPYFGTELMGSYIHAKSLFDAGVDVLGMICYEMIGFFSDQPNSQPFPFPEFSQIYPSTANFIMTIGIDKFDEFNKKICSLMSEGSTIDVYNLSFSMSNIHLGLADLSDHRNYWRFGYKALMINDTSFIRNPNYHAHTDTIDTLDFDKMTEVVNGAYHAIVNMHQINS